MSAQRERKSRGEGEVFPCSSFFLFFFVLSFASSPSLLSLALFSYPAAWLRRRGVDILLLTCGDWVLSRVAALVSIAAGRADHE